jgi:hypothetical protein
MDSKAHNPGSNVPHQADEEPRGDRGRGDRTWAPDPEEQGISNRPGDRTDTLPDAAASAGARGHHEVIEDAIEREENRNVEHDVQEDIEGRARRQTLTRRTR